MRATRNETRACRRWVQRHLDGGATALPFSFSYDGSPFCELAVDWKGARESRPTDQGRRVEDRREWTDPATGLRVVCTATTCADFPAVEWVLHLENTGPADTPIVQDLRALDVALECRSGPGALHYSQGGLCSMDDFAPVNQALNPGMDLQFAPGGGRSSSEVLPFFNLEMDGEGVVLGIGWTGEWQARFHRDPADRVRVQAGMAHTRFTLHPGERVRSPRILLLFWQEERLRGNNLLRRFLLAHHRPAPEGEPLSVPFFAANWGATPAAVHLENIRKIAAHDLPVEYYWIDAEWFGEGTWWNQPGNWQVKQDLYPEGFEPLSEALHAAGRKLLLWFEPERVCAGTDWRRQHPEWLLSLRPEDACYSRGTDLADPAWTQRESHRNQIADGDLLFDLGNPEARRWLTDFLAQRIEEFGLDCLRHDANIAPLAFWRNADAEDRQGIAEIRYVEGLYAMWDELLGRYPGLIIDNCASGGRRIDLETIGRSTAFWRTDFPADPVGKQCHTYGLLFWVPLQSTGHCFPAQDDDYVLRSSLCGGIALGLGNPGQLVQEIPEDFPFEQVKKRLEQHLQVRKFFTGDYYPLTRYSQARDAWMVYQLDLPESGEGLIVALKRPLSPFARGTFPLSQLQADSQYEITWLDTGESRFAAGQELGQAGLEICLEGRPDSALIHYRRVGQEGALGRS